MPGKLIQVRNLSKSVIKRNEARNEEKKKSVAKTYRETKHFSAEMTLVIASLEINKESVCNSFFKHETRKLSFLRIIIRTSDKFLKMYIYRRFD